MKQTTMEQKCLVLLFLKKTIFCYPEFFNYNITFCCIITYWEGCLVVLTLWSPSNGFWKNLLLKNSQVCQSVYKYSHCYLESSNIWKINKIFFPGMNSIKNQFFSRHNPTTSYCSWPFVLLTLSLVEMEEKCIFLWNRILNRTYCLFDFLSLRPKNLGCFIF